MNNRFTFYNRDQFNDLCPEELSVKRLPSAYSSHLNASTFNDLTESLEVIGISKGEIKMLLGYVFLHHTKGTQFWDPETLISNWDEKSFFKLVEVYSNVMLRQSIYANALPTEVSDAFLKIRDLFDKNEHDFICFIMNRRLYFIYYEICKCLDEKLISIFEINQYLGFIAN